MDGVPVISRFGAAVRTARTGNFLYPAFSIWAPCWRPIGAAIPV